MSIATYNNTTAAFECPRCGSVETFAIDLYFGNTANMMTVPIGSQYPFFTGRTPWNGGPLNDESPRGLGYTECPHCGKDFHCAAVIQDGILTSIAADEFELPFIPDRETSGKVDCPKCQSAETRLQLFNRFAFARLICDACSSLTLYRCDGDEVLSESSITKEYALVRNM
jgi:predicted RNA-binding Zn-ribbon protein involved in translation (DUF1610 family)